MNSVVMGVAPLSLSLDLSLDLSRPLSLDLSRPLSRPLSLDLCRSMSLPIKSNAAHPVEERSDVLKRPLTKEGSGRPPPIPRICRSQAVRPACCVHVVA